MGAMWARGARGGGCELCAVVVVVVVVLMAASWQEAHVFGWTDHNRVVDVRDNMGSLERKRVEGLACGSDSSGGLKERGGGALGWPRASTASGRRVKAPLLACCKGGVAFCSVVRRCHLDNPTGCVVEAVRANIMPLCDHLQHIQYILLGRCLRSNRVSILHQCDEDADANMCPCMRTADEVQLSRCPENRTQ